MSITINCGFARGVILHGLKNYNSHGIFDQILKDYERLFANFESFWTIEKKHLKDRFKAYQQFIKSKRVDTTLKDDIIFSFSEEVWGNLTTEEKGKHSLQDCSVR